MNFHLFAIQMPANSSLFKPSVTQPFSQTPYDLNNELLVCYPGNGLNNQPFDEQTVLDHLKTELVRYSDPHCIEHSNNGNIQLTNHWKFIIQAINHATYDLIIGLNFVRIFTSETSINISLKI